RYDRRIASPTAADNAKPVSDRTAITDHQLVAHAKKTHVKIVRVVPQRAGVRQHYDVEIGDTPTDRLGTHCAGGVTEKRAVAHDKPVKRAVVSGNQVA